MFCVRSALLVFLLASVCHSADRKIYVFINENPPTNYTVEPKNSVGFCGDNKTASLSFVADIGSHTIPSLNISFGFLSDGYRYWSLNTSTIQFNAKTYNLSMKWSDSPTSMGFKCSNMGLIAAVNSTPGVELSFLGLQVQPFGITNGVFTEANDCVGFFTTEIFSNLFIIFLLLGIFTYGLVMMMSVQTNDSFDDPKHKMIQIGGTSD